MTGSSPKSRECTFIGQAFSRMPLLCLPPGNRSPSRQRTPTLTLSLRQSRGWAGCQEDSTPAAPPPSGSVPSPYLCQAARGSWQPGGTGRKKAYRHTERNAPSIFKAHQAAFVRSLASTSLQTLF